MIICWDNLEKLKYNRKTGKWYKGKSQTTYIYKESCDGCGEPYLSQIYNKGNFCSNACQSINKNTTKGKKLSKKARKNISIGVKKSYLNGRKPFSWKGGYRKNNISFYDTYAQQLDWCEPVKRNKKDENILEVKCTYCGKWYIPTLQNVCDRIKCLNISDSMYESRFYCSESCKQECSIYNRRKWPKGFKIATSREVQPELRQIVLKRDNYKCVKCGSTKSLHCHHVEGIRWEPIESADIDKCLTLCKKCHKEVHEKEGCNYYEMQCKRSEK